jgi:drug/metabolite transporter (DMT)-like permease
VGRSGRTRRATTGPSGIVRGVRRRVDPGAFLLLTPVLWGATFPAAKLALRRLPVPAFMALTRTLGFASVLVLIPLLRRSGAGRIAGDARRVLLPGILLGGLIFVAYTLQTEGLARTTATNAGFITALYVVFVPIMAAVAFRNRVPAAAWVAVAASLAGLALLSIRHLDRVRVHSGDLLVLAGAVAWAGHVTSVGHFSRRFPAWLLSLAQMGFTALFQLAAAGGSGLRLSAAAGIRVWPLLVITGALGSGIAYTLQILGQQTLTAVRAVVILAGESIFAAIFAAVWIGERLVPHQWMGAALVLGAMAFSELGARRPPEQRIEPATAE